MLLVQFLNLFTWAERWLELSESVSKLSDIMSQVSHAIISCFITVGQADALNSLKTERKL